VASQDEIIRASKRLKGRTSDTFTGEKGETRATSNEQKKTKTVSDTNEDIKVKKAEIKKK